MINFFKILLLELRASFTRNAEHRGEAGEAVISNVLSRLPDNGEYSLFENLNLRWEVLSKKKLSQIDHVIVSRFGIFVIETKDWSGTIFASADSDQWKQSFGKYHKDKKGKFYQNPLVQNKRHIEALMEITQLPENVFHSLVVFTGKANFHHSLPDGIITHPHNLLQPILSRKSNLLSLPQVEAVEALVQKHNDPKSKKQHIRNIRRNKFYFWKKNQKKKSAKGGKSGTAE